MPPDSSPLPAPLAHAGQALRQVLLRLDHYAKKRVEHLDTAAPYAAAAMGHVQDLDALMTAVQEYEEAALACLFADNSPLDIHRMSPAELLAFRQADPVYRLGFVRGFKRGAAQAEQDPERVRRLFAQHAGRSQAPTYANLTERVRQLLANLAESYGNEHLSFDKPTPRQHGTV